MADLTEVIDGLPYFGAFWLFLASPRHRARCLARWREADRSDRLFLAGDAAVSTLCGLAPVVVVWYLLAS